MFLDLHLDSTATTISSSSHIAPNQLIANKAKAVSLDHHWWWWWWCTWTRSIHFFHSNLSVNVEGSSTLAFAVVGSCKRRRNIHFPIFVALDNGHLEFLTSVSTCLLSHGILRFQRRGESSTMMTCEPKILSDVAELETKVDSDSNNLLAEATKLILESSGFTCLRCDFLVARNWVNPDCASAYPFCQRYNGPPSKPHASYSPAPSTPLPTSAPPLNAPLGALRVTQLPLQLL